MTIEIDRPEVEALIRERLVKGGFNDPQEAILHALRASENSVPSQAGLLAALRSSSDEDAHNGPVWLKRSWASARDSGLEAMTMDEIDAEIAAARQARHHPRL